MSIKSYLEITMLIDQENRPTAAKVYADYREPFLTQIKGAMSKNLLIRNDDVQVLHGFDSVENAEEYLKSEMFNDDVFVGLKPLLSAAPEIKIFSVAQNNN